MQLFEVGVDEMSWDDLSQAKEDWPSVEAVTDYRRKGVFFVISSLLTQSMNISGPWQR
jgi:hypothetical protein